MNRNLFRLIISTGLFMVLYISCQQKADNSNQVLIQKIANQILAARSTNTIIQPVSKANQDLSLEMAYAVQVKLSDELSKTYGPVAGYKLGYADSSSLKKNNISVPGYGPIFQSQIKKSGESIPAGDFRNFVIEHEIVFTIAKSIDRKLRTIDELIPYVKSVHAGFDMSEIVFDGQTTIVDFVADGAGSKYFVLSEGLDPEKMDITNITLSIMFGDSTIYKGNSKRVLGNPWFALREVANDLLKRGYPLKAGDVIFSGKVAPAFKIQSEKAHGLYTGTAELFTDIHIWVK